MDADCVAALPAAFRRLCVETFHGTFPFFLLFQPPSGGCVLKLRCRIYVGNSRGQPPSGGCVLKRLVFGFDELYYTQPPSGGCVLKPQSVFFASKWHNPAAFRRLCVETFVVKW